MDYVPLNRQSYENNKENIRYSFHKTKDYDEPSCVPKL